MSQREAARLFGVGYSTLRAYEYLTRVPSGTLLARLLSLLDKHQPDVHEQQPDVDVEQHEQRLCPECGGELRPFADGTEWCRTWFKAKPQIAEALIARPGLTYAAPASWQYCESCDEAVLCPVRMAADEPAGLPFVESDGE